MIPSAWRPFMREAELNRQLLAEGLASLLKANCATIVRELVETLLVLSHRALVGRHLELPAFHEYFAVYCNDDRYLKGRRTFLV